MAVGFPWVGPSSLSSDPSSAASESRYRGPMAMDEVEIAARAAELVVVEGLALLLPDDLADTEVAIRRGLELATCSDEIAIRRQALALIDDAKARYRSPLAGAILKP